MNGNLVARLRRSLRPSQRCAECGADVEAGSTCFIGGRAYCHECGYEIIERTKGSLDHRPFV